MSLLQFFTRARFFTQARTQTAPAARERLQILLTHERSSGSQPDLVAILREEILAVVGKHVKIDPDAVEVRVERGKDISTLEIEVEVPVVAARATAPTKKLSHKKRNRAASTVPAGDAA
jgi:cell division topological specificity factor